MGLNPLRGGTQIKAAFDHRVSNSDYILLILQTCANCVNPYQAVSTHINKSAVFPSCQCDCVLIVVKLEDCRDLAVSAHWRHQATCLTYTLLSPTHERETLVVGMLLAAQWQAVLSVYLEWLLGATHKHTEFAFTYQHGWGLSKFPYF